MYRSSPFRSTLSSKKSPNAKTRPRQKGPKPRKGCVSGSANVPVCGYIYIWVFPKNSGTPKSSNSIGISIINHPFWGTPIFGNTHIQGMHISHLLYQVEVGLSDFGVIESTKQQGITCKVNPNIAPVRKALFKRHSSWMCHDPLCPERLQQTGPGIWGSFGTYSPINHLPLSGKWLAKVKDDMIPWKQDTHSGWTSTGSLKLFPAFSRILMEQSWQIRYYFESSCIITCWYQPQVLA